MTDIKCPECKSTNTTEWTETDAAMNVMIFHPNTYFCYDCGTTFSVTKEK